MRVVIDVNIWLSFCIDYLLDDLPCLEHPMLRLVNKCPIIIP